jgi:hypothetical protein
MYHQPSNHKNLHSDHELYSCKSNIPINKHTNSIYPPINALHNSTTDTHQLGHNNTCSHTTKLNTPMYFN